jgi:hypothetical protein
MTQIFGFSVQLKVLADAMDSDGRIMALMLARDLDWLAEWLTVRNKRLKNVV